MRSRSCSLEAHFEGIGFWPGIPLWYYIAGDFYISPLTRLAAPFVTATSILEHADPA
jgi:hypothetical protein